MVTVICIYHLMLLSWMSLWRISLPCVSLFWMPNDVMLNVVMLSVIMLRVVMLRVIMLRVIMLCVIMLHVIMLRVIMLRVIMLRVIMLCVIMLRVNMLNIIMLNVFILNTECQYAECCGTPAPSYKKVKKKLFLIMLFQIFFPPYYSCHCCDRQQMSPPTLIRAKTIKLFPSPIIQNNQGDQIGRFFTN